MLFRSGTEIEVDAVCDGNDFLIPRIMEHIERAGVHSGDSISVYPPQTLSENVKNKVVDYTGRLSKELGVMGLVNIQYVLYDGELFVIEVNPRSSRTVPYISKVTNIPVVELGTRVILGKKWAWRSSPGRAAKLPWRSGRSSAARQSGAVRQPRSSPASGSSPRP